VIPEPGDLDGFEDPITIGAALDGVIRSMRGPGSRVVGGVFGRWDEAVGSQVAQHVRPLKLDRGVLTVEVDDPAWATQVKFLTPTIISRLAEVAGASVERVSVRVDPRALRGARYR
jgi:predicted nucleic acid-binding Zn ribbon protein